MLVQFTLKNFLSFKNETTIDMTAIHAYKEHESNLIDIGTKEKFLRVAAIYGANASGKSNLYLAMLYFQRIIANSFNNIDRNGKKAIDEFYFPFSFVKEKKIGVDIERMNSLDDYSQIAKNFFLPPESERICAQTDAAKGMEKFYEIWTVKEAFVKALGHGLSRSLKSFEVLEQGTINDYTNNSRYNYYTKQLSDNYLCSLVVV